MPKKDRYIVGLDIGTTKVCILVAEIRDDASIDIIGMGSCDSKGLRKGVIINIDPTVECIKKVVEEAELMAGISIDEAFVGIAGEHIMGSNSRGMIRIRTPAIRAMIVEIPATRRLSHRGNQSICI